MTADRIIPVILSGGSGTRLWPLSLPERPKQLHALAGAPTMLQATAGRVADSDRFSDPVLVASERHADLVQAQLAAVGLNAELLILEPVGRNTAAAIALAAMAVDPGALLLVMPSDHVIDNVDAFLSALDSAAPWARQGHLITFGITPEHPETGYGYIKGGAPLGDGVFDAAAFVEKPDRETAARYLAEGGYYWNGGIFLFEARHVLAGLRARAPDLLSHVQLSVERGRRTPDRLYPDAAAFEAVEGKSIDHALLELHDRVAVVPVQMGWSDLGSWDALYDVSEKDLRGNSQQGDVVLHDSDGCLIRSTGPTIAIVGVHDLVVIATPEAVLILPRGESQRVKEVVARLSPSAKEPG